MKTYKHYCEDSRTSCKIISGLKTATIKQLEELSDWQERQNKDMFMDMQLRIIDFKDSELVIENYIEVSHAFIEKNPYLEPADILYGKYPEWELVKAMIYTTGILFYYYIFDKSGNVSDWTIIDLYVPQYIELELTIDSDADNTGKKYLISMRSNNGVFSDVTIKYYTDGKLGYVSSLQRDAYGTYELITKA